MQPRLVALFAAAARGALGTAPPMGPYATKQDVIPFLPGMTSAASSAESAAIITYPTGTAGAALPDAPPYPLIVFGHGAGFSGPAVGPRFAPLLSAVASYGFVVVSPTSCRIGDFTHDMLTAADDVMRNASLHPALATADFTRMGFFGHSNGGCAAQELAGDAQNVRKYNIKAAASEHCGCPCQTGPCRKYDAAGSNVPFMYVSMSGDSLTAAGAGNGYDLAGDGEKVLWVGDGGGHTEPTSAGGNREDQPVALFFACHVRGEHCDEVYGPSGDAICSRSKVKMNECKVHRAGPPPAPTPPAPPAQFYACQHNKCVTSLSGLPKARCEAACGTRA